MTRLDDGSMAGCNCCPSPVRAYSTVGGLVGINVRAATPLSSISRKRVLSTFAELRLL
jgi:hypothetical protein